MKSWFGLLLLFIGSSFFSACTEEAAHKETKTTDQELFAPPEDAPLPTALVAVDYLRLREEPRLDAAETAHLRAGELLQLSGEITGFRQPVRLRGLAYRDPWVRVRTQAGQMAWVYGGGLSFRDQPRSVVSQVLINGRLEHFLGKELAEKVKQYASEWESAACDETSFAERLKKSLELRRQIEKQIRAHFRYSGSLPDFHWLTSSFPPFFVVYDRSTQQLRLYRDFKALHRLATRCRGEMDDELVELYFELFSLDSLEHDRPSYLLEDAEKNQTWFLMEDGQALQLLQKLSKLYEAGGIYREEAVFWKNSWLEDLLKPDYPFWNDPERVRVEINTILEQNLSILSKEDKQQLKRALEKLHRQSSN